MPNKQKVQKYEAPFSTKVIQETFSQLAANVNW